MIKLYPDHYLREGHQMKANTHPAYTYEANAACVCGNTFVTGSTKKELRVEICSRCHPFYTGQQKIVDTEGRVERFRKKLAQKKEKETAQ